MEPTKTVKISEVVLNRALGQREKVAAALGLTSISTLQLMDWLVTQSLDIMEGKGKNAR